jgi:hypothetical protein
VYAVEQRLGELSAHDHPEIGRDIKVMGIRRGRRIDLPNDCVCIRWPLPWSHQRLPGQQARKRIAGREVVRDDLVVLAEGDRMPVDANLQTDESLSTGESVPVRKIRHWKCRLHQRSPAGRR